MIWRDCPDTEMYGLQDILYLDDNLNEHISDIMVKKQSETDLDTESPVEVDRIDGDFETSIRIDSTVLDA